MIRIANTFVGPEVIAAEAPLGPMELLVLGRLAPSQLMYSYRRVEELLFELRMRTEIIRAARELNASGIRFAVDQYSTANPAFGIGSRTALSHCVRASRPR